MPKSVPCLKAKEKRYKMMKMSNLFWDWSNRKYFWYNEKWCMRTCFSYTHTYMVARVKKRTNKILRVRWWYCHWWHTRLILARYSFSLVSKSLYTIHLDVCSSRMGTFNTHTSTNANTYTNIPTFEITKKKPTSILASASIAAAAGNYSRSCNNSIIRTQSLFVCLYFPNTFVFIWWRPTQRTTHFDTVYSRLFVCACFRSLSHSLVHFCSSLKFIVYIHTKRVSFALSFLWNLFSIRSISWHIISTFSSFAHFSVEINIYYTLQIWNTLLLYARTLCINYSSSNCFVCVFL